MRSYDFFPKIHNFAMSKIYPVMKSLLLLVLWSLFSAPVPEVNEAVLSKVRAEAAAVAKSHKRGQTAVGVKSKNAEDPSGFVLVSDVIPDVIMEPRYYSTYNFVGTRIDGYEEPVVLCTREAAAALKKVADDLRPKGYLIKIYDAYRPQKAVSHFVRWAKTSDVKMQKDFYPGMKKSKLFPTYIATKSGHSKGSTFDLTLVDAKTGKELDMGGPFDFFGKISGYAYPKVTAAQKANRKLLHDAMCARGFKPYSNEWWHFTLKNEPYPNVYFNFVNSSKQIK